MNSPTSVEDTPSKALSKTFVANNLANAASNSKSNTANKKGGTRSEQLFEGVLSTKKRTQSNSKSFNSSSNHEAIPTTAVDLITPNKENNSRPK